MARKPHTIQTIEVAGPGDFPVDMLRYDMAVPVRSEDAISIAQMIGEAHEMGGAFGVGWDNPIRLHVFMPGGATTARWLSFGWSVREVL